MSLHNRNYDIIHHHHNQDEEISSVIVDVEDGIKIEENKRNTFCQNPSNRSSLGGINFLKVINSLMIVAMPTSSARALILTAQLLDLILSINIIVVQMPYSKTSKKGQLPVSHLCSKIPSNLNKDLPYNMQLIHFKRKPRTWELRMVPTLSLKKMMSILISQTYCNHLKYRCQWLVHPLLIKTWAQKIYYIKGLGNKTKPLIDIKKY